MCKHKRPALAWLVPCFADLSGVPPLIIQAGSYEVLLERAVRLPEQAATADGARGADGQGNRRVPPA
jgi:hypothetical protein